MEQTTTTIIAAIGTFIAGIFGKEGWNYLTRRAEISSENDCRRKIRQFEVKLNQKDIREQQLIVGMDMLLTLFEEEFKDQPNYSKVISKVRDIINATENDQINENGDP